MWVFADGHVVDACLVATMRGLEVDDGAFAVLAEAAFDGAVVDEADDVVDDSFARVLLRRSDDELAILVEQHAERRGIVAHVVDGVAEPGEVDVEAAHAGDAVVRIDDGTAEGGEAHGVGAVHIGVAPQLTPLGGSGDECRVLRVVVGGGGKLANHNLVVLLGGIRLEEAALRWIIIR